MIRAWSFKYPVRTLKDLVLPADWICEFGRQIEDRDTSPLLLYGPCGTGKTSLAKVLAEGIADRGYCREYDGSDPPTPEALRYLQSNNLQGGRWTDSPWVILIDEAQVMSQQSQVVLRSLITKYIADAKFILTVNDVQKIDAPLRSRCGIRYDFGQLPELRAGKLARLASILAAEKKTVSEARLDELIRLYPDWRNLLDAVQHEAGGTHEC